MELGQEDEDRHGEQRQVRPTPGPPEPTAVCHHRPPHHRHARGNGQDGKDQGHADAPSPTRSPGVGGMVPR